MIKTESEDFKAGWDDEPATADEFAAKGETQERTLADQLAAGKGEKVAFKGDGVMTTAEHQAYKDAMGEFIDGSKPEETKNEGAGYKTGKDDALSTGVKQRNFDAGYEENVKKLMKQGVSRKAAENMQKASRPQ